MPKSLGMLNAAEAFFALYGYQPTRSRRNGPSSSFYSIGDSRSDSSDFPPDSVHLWVSEKGLRPDYSNFVRASALTEAWTSAGSFKTESS